MSYVDSLTLGDINKAVEKLQDSIEGTDTCMVDIYELQEKLEARIVVLENSLTSVIKELNKIARFVNKKHGGFKVVSEID